MQSNISSILATILKVLFIGSIIFVILSFAARTSNIGYTSKYTVMSVSTFSFGRTHQFAYRDMIYLQIAYNPILFPITCLSGNGNFSGPTIVLHNPEEDAGDVGARIRVAEEAVRNMPYLLTISLLAGLVIEESIFHLRKRMQSKEV
jgi:hypothetical protein